MAKKKPATSGKEMISLRLSAEARSILDALQARLGISRTAVLEQLIRVEGRKLIRKP